MTLLLLLACSPEAPPAAVNRPALRPSGPAVATRKGRLGMEGSGVAGWPEVERDPGLSSARYRFDNPTMWRVVGEIAEVDGVVRPVRLYLETRDCASFACDGSQPREASTPFLSASLGLMGDDGATDALGWWGPDATTARVVRGGGYAVFGRAGNQARNGHGINAEVSVCLSRLRPDSVSGVLFFRLPTPGDPVQFWVVEAVEFWTPFTFTLPEHAGATWPADARPGGLEGDASLLEWRYLGVSYDDAWPWRCILDPKIRESLYNRYTPGVVY